MIPFFFNNYPAITYPPRSSAPPAPISSIPPSSSFLLLLLLILMTSFPNLPPPVLIASFPSPLHLLPSPFTAVVLFNNAPPAPYYHSPYSFMISLFVFIRLASFLLYSMHAWYVQDSERSKVSAFFSVLSFFGRFSTKIILLVIPSFSPPFLLHLSALFHSYSYTLPSFSHSPCVILTSSTIPPFYVTRFHILL